MPAARLLICSRPCGQCLTTRKRIVCGERAAELIRQCRDEDVQFQCHLGSFAGLNIHCRGVHEANGPSRSYRFAQAFDIEIVEIDPDDIPTFGGEGPDHQGAKQMSRVYLAKVGETESLIEAGNINAARNHVAKKTITIGLASQADLFRLAKDGAEIEKVPESN